MSRILIAYSTVDGHTRLICSRLQQHLDEAGHAATLVSLGERAAVDVQRFDKIVVGASIRYGKHRPEVYDFIKAHRAALEHKPGAFFSVNLVARKPGKDTAAGNPYIRAFRRESRWAPRLVTVFAGKLDYQKYGPLDRSIVRLIMWLTQGPTDPSACVDFTDWQKVKAFARQIADLA